VTVMTQLDQLVDLFVRASRPVIFTGAGVSTESGIPDFRSPGGIWDRYAPIEYADFMVDPEARRETWRRGLQTYPVLLGARPKPATVSFGEQLPLEAIQRAERAARGCDLFVVVGSSLVVYPAAGFPELALRGGAPLAIVNASPTHLDSYAAVRFEAKAGEVFAQLMERLLPRLESRLA